jgi:hypothetical protein
LPNLSSFQGYNRNNNLVIQLGRQYYRARLEQICGFGGHIRDGSNRQTPRHPVVNSRGDYALPDFDREFSRYVGQTGKESAFTNQNAQRIWTVYDGHRNATGGVGYDQYVTGMLANRSYPSEQKPRIGEDGVAARDGVGRPTVYGQ